jgi:Sulfotransferase family
MGNGDSQTVAAQADRLDAADLLLQARASSGLDDFGDDTLPQRFSLAVDHLNSLGLDQAGRLAAVGVCLWLLTSRLQLFEDFRRYPVAQEKIEQPVIAIGEGRSGTTFLHALLSVDPNGRALRFWDPRRAQADDDWREINARLPGWLPMHPYNDMLGDGIPECERTWAHDFRALTPTAWWRVPMVMHPFGLPTDHRAQYRLHKMMLQQCQYHRPKKYWVLKGFHQARLPALLEAYPDARIIWTHRDPVQVIASAVYLSCNLNEMLAGKADWQAAAQMLLEGMTASMLGTLNNPLIDDPRIHHVRYRDLTHDPVATLSAFYAKFGLPCGPETEAAWRAYIAGNRSDRYGKFRYSTDILGVDIGALHETFAPYRAKFGIDIEAKV